MHWPPRIPTPSALTHGLSKGLGTYPWWAVWKREGYEAMAISLSSTACIPLLSGKGRSTRWPGGGAVSGARIPPLQPPALPPSLCSSMATPPPGLVGNEEQVLEDIHQQWAEERQRCLPPSWAYEEVVSAHVPSLPFSTSKSK